MCSTAVSVPLSGPEFLQGLQQRFPERDGMYFLPDQVTEYDRKRTTATELRQLSLFVNDEASAIQWIRQQLQDKPQSFQDLQPQFMRELQAWAKHEQTIELKEILELNFFCITTDAARCRARSTATSPPTSKTLRNLDKEDSKLIEKARDRWYVPDPNKQADLERSVTVPCSRSSRKSRTAASAASSSSAPKQCGPASRPAGRSSDYDTIVKVAAKLPEAVLQEDEKLLMYNDNAQTRLGDDA